MKKFLIIRGIGIGGLWDKRDKKQDTREKIFFETLGL